MTENISAHTIDMEQVTGNEYILPVGSTLGVHDYLNQAQEFGEYHQYNQFEFQNIYGPNLCTLYGVLNAVSSLTNYIFTPDERKSLCSLRSTLPDFNRDTGGTVVAGVNLVRKWWNERHPENEIVYFQVGNMTELRRQILTRRFSVVSGFSGNQAYNADAADGILEGTSFGTPTFGHCTMEVLSTVVDTNDRKYDRRDYMGCAKNGVLHNFSYVFFRVNDLSDSMQYMLSAMKAGIWNGGDADRIATRYECATMCARFLYGKDATADQFIGWNKERPNDPLSYDEAKLICERAGLEAPKNETRGAIAEVIGKKLQG